MIWKKVSVQGDLNREANRGLGRLARYAEIKGEDVFITSIRDGMHMLGSFHYIGEAWDQRPLKIVTIKEARRELGKEFQLIDQGTYWHIERDNK